MSANAARGWSARRVIRAVLAAQVAIAAILVVRDLDGTLPSFAPRAPELEAPVRPGDQTRRYRLPTRPGAVPIPVRGDLPTRLALAADADGAWSLRGTIAPGDAERVGPAIEREAPERLTLNSPGGSVYDALAIGRAIRAAGTDTAVEDGAVCLSACPYLLAGGVERRVAPEAMVGVHQHYFGESTVLPAFMAVEDVQRGQAEVMDYLVEMDLDPLLMRHALATPPGEIYLLVEEELREYRVVTEPDQ